jgi:gamma-glutamyltranspeptidase/glutathione hydrolase
MQPQGHVQMMVRIFDYGQNPQAACDAPRWIVNHDFSISLEPGFSPNVIEELKNRGHKVMSTTPAFFFGGGFGGAQLVFCLKDGYCAASDPRKDGLAVGF